MHFAHYDDTMVEVSETDGYDPDNESVQPQTDHHQKKFFDNAFDGPPNGMTAFADSLGENMRWSRIMVVDRSIWLVSCVVSLLVVAC